jgi:hypothetical protein
MRSQSEGRMSRSARRMLGTSVLSCVVPDERQPVLCTRDQATEDPDPSPFRKILLETSQRYFKQKSIITPRKSS